MFSAVPSAELKAFYSELYANMSKVNRRKHVLKETEWVDEPPKENQSIVKILQTRGNNLHLITTPNGEEYLVSMPMKFRRNIWVKRGDYILVEPIAEGDKVKAEIVRVLNRDAIKYFKENDIWPKEFQEDPEVIFDDRNPNYGLDWSSESSDSESDDTESDSGSESDSERYHPEIKS